jgi:hypothetical protein
MTSATQSAKSARHTEEAWACTTRQGSWDWVVYVASDPNNEVCQMFHDGTDLNEIGEARAHLVAAAPDMLAALVEVLAGWEATASVIAQDDRVEDLEFGAFMKVRAAISKAMRS